MCVRCRFFLLIASPCSGRGPVPEPPVPIMALSSSLSRSFVTLRGALVAAGLFAILAPTALTGQAMTHAEHGGVVDPQAVREGAPPLLTELGDFHWGVTTSNPLAQAYFDQGVRLVFGFAHGVAVASFEEARRLDPGCAMCAWGEAWSLAPYINSPGISNPQERRAWEAVQAAQSLLRPDSPPVERALIEAMQVRFRENPEGGRTRQDSLFALAMVEVEARFPNDLQVRTLGAEAWMILSPWNFWDDEGAPRPGTDRILESLEFVLGVELGHPGACHLYIHAVEASRDPGRAAPCATKLETAIPGVSHIPHMPAHVFMRIGRYGDAVRGNQRAWHADQRAASGATVAVYASHNLHMLAFAASFDGQQAVAIQAARDLARIAPGSAFYLPVTWARFGRWAELLETPVPDVPVFQQGIWHFGRGLAAARAGSGTHGTADAELAALRQIRANTAETARFRRHPQVDLLRIAEGILEGELLAARGDHAGAIRALETARALEAGLPYDEPEPWFIPVAHVLGAVLIEAGRPSDAERVYRESLTVHPENGWALKGLADAIRAQAGGREAEIADLERRLEGVWVRSDTWLPGSRF
jgi:tetratricopeptide (TPR) repeat protein